MRWIWETISIFFIKIIENGTLFASTMVKIKEIFIANLLKATNNCNFAPGFE